MKEYRKAGSRGGKFDLAKGRMNQAMLNRTRKLEKAIGIGDAEPDAKKGIPALNSERYKVIAR
jgi:hypothetical protein